MTTTALVSTHPTETKPCCIFDVRTKHRHEFVYIVVYEREITKIGRTDNPHVRLAHHAAHTWLRAIEGWLYAVRDSYKAERILLDIFQNYRINEGEWFVIPRRVRHGVLLNPAKFRYNGVTFWPYCAAHDERCELCDALADL